MCTRVLGSVGLGKAADERKSKREKKKGVNLNYKRIMSFLAAI